jgi:tRNA(Ile)-lysidine synthase
LIGVSGGPDSTALLCLFVELRDQEGGAPFPELLAGHVHHGIRGREADLDAEFVEDLARKKGVPFLIFHGRAREEALRWRLSPEGAARALRYRAFRRWAVEQGVDAVALAHHLDDQAETVLLRAIRGSGVRGLAGIPRDRFLLRHRRVTRLIRPLLRWRRSWILDYLRERGQVFRVDSTNQDLLVPRNRLRLEVLPLLEQHVQGGTALSLARLGEMAGMVARDLRSLGLRLLGEAVVASGDDIGLRIDLLQAWPPSVLYETFHAALQARARRARGAADPPAARASGQISLPRTVFNIVLAWLQPGAPSAARVAFGRGESAFCLEMRYGIIRIRPARRAAPTEPVVLRSQQEEKLCWLGWEFQLKEMPAAAEPLICRPDQAGPEGAEAFEERLDAEVVARSGPISVRSRRRGDRFQPLGLAGSKSLKTLFRERRVWPSERDSVPLLVAGDDIVWVVGHRIDHRFRIRPETTRVLAVTATRKR